MSWSFHGIGRPAAVLAKAQAELPRMRCVEPEETVKGKLLEALEAALDNWPDNYAVRVAASGSQFMNDGKSTQTLSVTIEPLLGFAA